MSERINVLGTGVSVINMGLALDAIGGWIASDARSYVCITGVHGVMESYRDPELRLIHNRAGMVTPDGMPLVWLGRTAGFKNMARVYGPDLMLAVCEQSLETGWRHFLYGGGEDVAEKLAASLRRRFPGLQIVGALTPPFRPLTEDEDAEVVRTINDSGADIVWVGLGTPKQERWMAEHFGRVTAPVMIGVGAAFDFHSGLKRQAPQWMRRAGLEWFFRLLTEPRRLWRRYLTNNPAFAALVLQQRLGLATYPDDWVEGPMPASARGTTHGWKDAARRGT